tara:strand:+ start:173 stop:1243 length:1071 start_codon:yes stop_codon:yes gene_type:complete
MPKPNQNSSVTEMKAYIRSKKINHPDVKLGLKKADMIAGLKKAGHWDEVAKVKKTRAKPVAKAKPVAPVKKVTIKSTPKVKIMTPKKAATPVKANTDDVNSTNKQLKMRFVKKIKGFKKADLEKLLNFNGDALIKIDNNYYGSNNWVDKGVAFAKKQMIDLMSKTTAGFGVGYTDTEMNNLLKIFDNYKTSFKSSTPVKAKTPAKDEPLTKEQYEKLIRGSPSDLTEANRRQIMDYKENQIKGAKISAYNKPFLIVNGREIWVDNKYIMTLGNQMVERNSKILGWFTKDDLWAKYNKFQYPEDPPEKKGLKYTAKEEGSIDLAKVTKKGTEKVLWNNYNLNTKKEAQDKQDKMKAM